ncbi:hypothetical protein A7W90_12315 [Clostridium sp. Bc-iso-3]|nr:hypothetical protein A7W90_12315 [Clostridium sp. Bc-iso-3]
MIFINNVTKNHIMDGDGIHLAITKHEVRSMNLNRVRQILKTFEDAGKHGRNKLMISFLGYEYSLKEVYEIEEIRNYVNILFNEFPHIFYFLSDINGSRTVFLLCLCNKIKTKKTSPLSVNVFAASPGHLTRRIIDGILDYGAKIGESKEILSEIIDKVLDPKPNEEYVKALTELSKDIDLRKLLGI